MGSAALRGVPARIPTLELMSASRNIEETIIVPEVRSWTYIYEWAVEKMGDMVPPS